MNENCRIINTMLFLKNKISQILGFKYKTVHYLKRKHLKYEVCRSSFKVLPMIRWQKKGQLYSLESELEIK